MSKNNIILVVILVAGLFFVGVYIWTSNILQTPDVVNYPEPSVSPTVSPEVSSSPSPSPTPKPSFTKVPVPLPTGNGQTSFIGETVPWSLLLADASCELKGEIKFFDHNTYDNHDAL